ncbi:toxin glutamine deamidase domain-containing protein [Micromonospora sp. MA102]|uniref:toxin glutamine deamidase domain-containing protein n=1 Tax=Micromonospora sp. MA102 TaxID=2952755 RepID=UPI0021C823F1|nr:toxin glutamine deamidase domain-containing protein [Micromonospora sp. MA102]
MAATGELGKLVDSCGCDIEGAKLEAWIELGILVVELLSLAVATVLTMGAASPAAGAAITASRVAVQQIFKRLVAQLAHKAVKEGLKEAGERAAKEVVKSGARGLARRAVLAGLVEAGQEAGTSLATQAYQNSTGRRDGLDLTDVGMSGLGGFAGGAAAPLAGLGRHAHEGFARIGEHFGREMAGETLAESAAGLATGQDLSLEDIARAAASGVSGSATAQADSALHHRLDEKLAGLPAQPVDLGLPPSAGAIPSQRMPDPVTLPGDPGPVPHPGTAESASASNPPSSLVGDGPPAHLPSVGVAAGVGATPAHRVDVAVTTDPPTADATTSAARASAGPTLSAVAVETPVAGAPGSDTAEPTSGPVKTSGLPGVGTPTQTAPMQAAAPPTVVGPPAAVAPPAHGPIPAPADQTPVGTTTGQVGSLAAPSAHPNPAPVAGPGPGASVSGPDPRPVPNPRFPLLEALAPPRPASDPPPTLPGPSDPPPPRRMTPQERAARLTADREALDRRRYHGYLRSQREWYEESRRQQRADWLRERADYHEERASDWGAQATEFDRAGRDLAAARWYREAREASIEALELREEAQRVLAGSVVPAEVMVEDDVDFYRINDDVADLALGAVETADHSALTGDGRPPPIDRSRRYGMRGGLRPPLALHQTDLERQMPRHPDGRVVRTADPRRGGWFRLANDGGPAADATRGINCLDCTLSLFETWMHGRPRVSAPRTFDGYLLGDVHRPVGGEADGPRRVEETTGGRFQNLCPAALPGVPDHETRRVVEGGYRDLHGQLLAGGHGSYAFLITTYEGGGSHAWVALNQDGSVLYLDPQTGRMSRHPLYTHSGVRDPHNVVGVDALVLGPDGNPMPLAGRPPGDYNVLPDPVEPSPPPRPVEPPPPPAPDDGDSPDFNHVHLLGETTTFHHRPDGTSFPGSAPDTEPEAIRTRNAHRDAHADRIAAGLYVRDALAASGSLDEVFAAGVTPVELAQHADGPTLQRLVPELDPAAAGDLTRLLADPRVRQMLDHTWEAPPRHEGLLAETLVRQLAQRPDLVRMILSTPELANSLTARPITLHHLASHQEAIDVLGDVLNDIATHGPGAVITPKATKPLPTPVTEDQRRIAAAIASRGQSNIQLGFDDSRRDDETYRLAYVDQLYVDATVAQQELTELAIAVAGDDGQPDWRTEPKSRERVLDKLVEYENDAAQLKDLAGAKVQFRRLDDIYRSLDRLSADPDVVILHIKDRFLKPQQSGYRDVLLNLRMSNGHVAELRLHLNSLDEIAEWEHALYEVRRDLEVISEADGRPLTERERALRDGLLRRAQDIYWRALNETTGEAPPQ